MKPMTLNKKAELVLIIITEIKNMLSLVETEALLKQRGEGSLAEQTEKFRQERTEKIFQMIHKLASLDSLSETDSNNEATG